MPSLSDTLAHLQQKTSIAPMLEAWSTDAVLRETLQIQAVPAPTFAEGERSRMVQRRFTAMGLHDVHTDDLHNVYARTPGLQPEVPALMVSAHLDTVFPAETDLTTRRVRSRVHGPGIGDNSLGLAAMLQLAERVQQSQIQLPCDVWWVATVGEEGLGDLRGMRSAVETLNGRLGVAIVLEGIGLGKVYNAGLGVRRLRISVEGPGGHSWLHPKRPSAVHHLMRIGAAILEETTLPRRPRSSLNIGLVEGGTSINTRAASASMAIDMRSTHPETLAEIEGQVMGIVEGFSEARNLRVTVEVVGDRPSAELSPQHPLVESAQNILRHMGYKPSPPEMGSTDANIPLDAGIPSVCIGITVGGDAHTTNEYILLDPIPSGMRQLTLLTLMAAENIEAWSTWA